jgi:TonB family protein
MALSLTIFFAGLAAAAEQPAAVEPTANWSVQFDDAQCVATRPYGSAEEPLFFVLKAPPIGEVMQIAVMRMGDSRSVDQAEAVIRADERPVLRTNLMMFTPKGANLRVYLLNMTSADFSQVRAAKRLALRSSGLNTTFALSQMGPLLTIVDQCVADLRKIWNVSDPTGEQSKLPQRARPRANLASYVRNEDYPAAAITKNQSGVVRFALLIDEQGQVADCTVIETSGVAVLDTQSCAVMKQRAKFEPARGPDGKPAKDALLSAIRWLMP